ncbi:MAG TPA: PD-(D/E)XK nuclease family protein [Polyangiaceae bacterium]|nr:PD-(D/E)XK nuclease family protein [Polyangiaceae bacterium]
MSFTNTHLSYSRLSRFEQCPLSFKLHYIDYAVAEPGLALVFGKLIHAVLERLLREVVHQELTGPLSEQRALELYREAWTVSGLTGLAVFSEGFAIVREFVREQGIVSHRDVVAIEQEFHLPVDGFEVLGFIDRVDYLDSDSIEIIDYKTNHLLFTREELDSSLQMSLYEVAARRLWPWVKHVKLTFWMLRHSIRQSTSRTPEQLEAALTYVAALGAQTEKATEYPARLNLNCCYCDHRKACPAYEEALKGKRVFECDDLTNLEDVAKEREEVAALAKILHARKDELESVLKTQLKEKPELVLAGKRYRMFKTESAEYPLERTVSLLTKTTGTPRETLIEEIGSVDKKSLDALVKRLGEQLDKSTHLMLKAELDATAVKRFSSRFWASEVA